MRETKLVAVKRYPAEHVLKIWPNHYDAVVAGDMTWIARKREERDFQIGDTLLLEEYDPVLLTYTRRTCNAEVTNVTALTMCDAPGILVMTIKKKSFTGWVGEFNNV